MKTYSKLFILAAFVLIIGFSGCAGDDSSGDLYWVIDHLLYDTSALRGTWSGTANSNVLGSASATITISVDYGYISVAATFPSPIGTITDYPYYVPVSATKANIYEREKALNFRAYKIGEAKLIGSNQLYFTITKGDARGLSGTLTKQ